MIDLSLDYLPRLTRRKDFRIGCAGAGFIMRDCHLVAYRQAGFNPVAIAAKKAFPNRATVAVTGEAGLGYMLGNLEVLLREKLGVTVAHISNGGFAGYGPGFWGPGHDPFTHSVLGPDEVDMSKVIGALGFHSERVREPTEIIPALLRALAANASGRPAYIEFVCCQYPVYGQWVGRSSE